MPGRRSALPLTVTAVTRGVASEQDGKEHMIGCQWIVCHRHSGGESAGIPAAGLAGKPDMATSAVEMIVDEADRAAWGLMVRFAMEGVEGVHRCSSGLHGAVTARVRLAGCDD